MRTPAACIILLLPLLPHAIRAEDQPPPVLLELQAITPRLYVREPSVRHFGIVFKASGPAAGDVRAGRALVTRAVDDTGAELKMDGEPLLRRVAVGSVSPADRLAPIPPILECSISSASAQGTKLAVLEGKVELVVPALDPDATAVIAGIAVLNGSAADSAALRAAGVEVKPYLKAAFDTQLASSAGFEAYGVRLDPRIMASLPPEMVERMRKGFMPSLDERGIALAIMDPGKKLIGVEFVDGHDRPLVYNRNGSGHWEQGVNGGRLDLYRFESVLPPDAKLICWLVTEKSFVVVPFQYADLPLPPGKSASPPATSR